MPQVSSAYATKQRAQRLARIGIIAALYAALTLAALLFLGGLAWGPVQFRISEAVVVIALFTADAIPGLTLGCVIANLANMVISGTGAFGIVRRSLWFSGNCSWCMVYLEEQEERTTCASGASACKCRYCVCISSHFASRIGILHNSIYHH